MISWCREKMHASCTSLTSVPLKLLKASACGSGFCSITQSSLLAVSLGSLSRDPGFFQNAFREFISSGTLELHFFKTRRGSGSRSFLYCPNTPFTATNLMMLVVSFGGSDRPTEHWFLRSSKSAKACAYNQSTAGEEGWGIRRGAGMRRDV